MEEPSAITILFYSYAASKWVFVIKTLQSKVGPSCKGTVNSENDHTIAREASAFAES